MSNGQCKALFHRTKNLGYLLISNFLGNGSLCVTARNLSYSIANAIRHHLFTELQALSNTIENMLVQIDQPCNENILSSLQFSGHIAMKIFVKHTVKRVDFEDRLIALTTKMNISTVEISHLSLTWRKEHYDFNPFNIHMAEYFSRCTVPVYFENNFVRDRHQYRTVRLSKVLTCVQIQIEPYEYSFDEVSGELKVLQTDATYEKSSYDILPNGSVRICAEDVNSKNYYTTSNKGSSLILLSDITLLLDIISILCLISALFIFIFHKDLRTLPGKMNMVLILSLALTLSFFQLSKLGTYHRDICVVFGIALHYFWLQSFASMFTCSFHMWRLFRSTQIFSNSEFKSILKKYLTFIALLPFCIVSLNVTIMGTTSNNGSIGYGTERCFIDNSISRLISFVIPVGVMCLSNLFFFVGTLISIRNVPAVPGTKSVRNEFWIYCRLFTITGITWTLQIIDGFLPLSPYSYISSIINSLQGTAIFVAFILNRRVINLIRKSCKCRPHQIELNNRAVTGESDMDRETYVTRL